MPDKEKIFMQWVLQEGNLAVGEKPIEFQDYVFNILKAQAACLGSAEKVFKDIQPQIRGALRIQDVENWLRDYRALKEKYG